MSFRVPIATFRAQFNAQFRFDDARAIVPYLERLGITDLYASPLLRPRKGSQHGYDIVDATMLNPELGGEEAFAELHHELSQRGMGLLLDIVPNHMAASHENDWWMSVLENGQQSRFVHYFDIDWRPGPVPGGPETRVLLPMLGRPYGETLESQEIRLGFDEGGFFVTYYDKRLPLAPASYRAVLRECLESLPAEGPAVEVRDLVENESVIANSRFLKETLWRIHEQSPEFREALGSAIERFNGRAGDQESFNLLDSLLEAQWYRLAYWRIASETINYRRFFDVTDLVGLKIENPEVFELRNRRILELIGEGKLTGVRIDHIDGLFDPISFLSRLQLRLGDPGTDERERFYVVVEKILAEGEDLPAAFACSGTTGYDFLGVADPLFVDASNLGQLDRLYHQTTGCAGSYEDIVYDRKKQVIEQLFSGEMRALGAQLGVLAMADRNARDFAPSELAAALVEITASLSVYRTYIRDAEVAEADRLVIERAIDDARRRARGIDRRLFDFLELLLLVSPPRYIESERDRWVDFVKRWQQFTGRVMAKGVEDTTFYNYNRLISLNEVGAEPGIEHSRDVVRSLHERNARIALDWPHTLNATSTHDTKRSEDVRARIHVLSELADWWSREAKRWMRINAQMRRNGVPDANEELLLYQTLLGVWPFDAAEHDSLPERLDLFLEKALREAKTHSSWLEQNDAYESDMKAFARAILGHERFLAAFRPAQRRVAFHGFLNSLALVVLKICSPGVPDFYQGTDLWNFSLVDPDNRRPVDYAARVASLQRAASAATLLRQWKDGRVKQFVTAQGLAVRKRQIEAMNGSYEAVSASVETAFAFLRGGSVLAVVPRLTTRLVRPPRLPVGEVWGDAALAMGGRWRNAFTGEVVEGDTLRLADVFATFPVAILERE